MSDPSTGLRVKGREILGACPFPDREFEVKRYDFRRPDKFSKDQIRTVAILHEAFSRLLDTRLSALLGTAVNSSLKQVDQMTFAEFIDTVESPSLLAQVTMEPLKGPALVHIQPPLREAMLDRLFGDPSPVATAENARELTDIEFASFEGLLGGFCVSLGEAWRTILERSSPTLVQVETNPRFAQIVPPQEMVVLAALEVEAAGARALVHLVYPYLTLDPITSRLSAAYWYSSQDRKPVPKERLLPASTTWRLSGPAELLIDGARLSAAELRGLRRGSLVDLPGLDEGRAWLRAGGVRVLELGLEGRDGLARGGYGREGRLGLRVEKGPEQALPEELLPAIPGREGGVAVERLEAGLGSLRESFEKALAGLAEGLKRVESGQTAFADRLAFGGDEVSGGAAAPGESRPFASLGSVSSEDLGLFLAMERPQLVALVLSWLDDSPASRIVDLLPPGLRLEVIRRLAQIERVAPEILAAVERVLLRKMKTVGTERRSSGGIAKIVGILNQTRRETEKQIVEDLDGIDKMLCEEIKKNMFVFEDLSLLDAESMSLLLGRSDENDILLGLKPLDAAMRAKVLARAEPPTASRLLARVEAMGRVRLSECDAAGQRVVAVARDLDMEGLLGLILPGEEA